MITAIMENKRAHIIRIEMYLLRFALVGAINEPPISFCSILPNVKGIIKDFYKFNFAAAL